MITYRFTQWILCFFIYGFIGWIYEVILVSTREKRFVNRGYLNGPILPIYGFGACGILLFILPFKDNLLLTFMSGMLSATLLELITGETLYRCFHVRYWDYRRFKYNYHGHICIEASLLWGCASLLLTNIVHFPYIHYILTKITTSYDFLIIFGLLLTILDFIDATKQAMDLSKLLQAKAQLDGKIDELRLELSLMKMELRQALQEDYHSKQHHLALFKAEIKYQKYKLDTLLQSLNDEEAKPLLMQQISQKQQLHAYRIIERNPHLKELLDLHKKDERCD